MNESHAWVLLFALATAGAAGCGGGDKKEGDGPASAGESVGVAECDEYLTKMEACIAKMPPENRAAQEQAFKHSREEWKKTASSPQGKESLKVTCKAAVDAMTRDPMCR